MKQWNVFRLCGVFLLCIAIGNSAAAIIKGTVTDTLTGANVESVLVAVQGANAQTYTDAQGRFALNTTIGIRGEKNSGFIPMLEWAALQGAAVEIYAANGLPVQSGQASAMTGMLNGLPDGVYLAKTIKDGRAYTGKIIKTHVLCQTGSFISAAAKAATAVTLVYSHKYYTTQEAVAAEGDTDVTMKLTMWFPDSTTTGPKGILTPSAALTASTSGAIIENMDVSGGIIIKASNITIRNCRFSSLYISVYDTFCTGIVVEDSELGWAGVRNFTLRRCKMKSTSDDLIRIGGANITIEDCFLLITGPQLPGDHSDVIQEYPEGTGKNCVVRHNTLYNALPQTSCFISPTDILIEKNLLAGGGYSIYINPGQRIEYNHFSTRFYLNCGGFGPMTGSGATTCIGNVWHETGAPISCP